MTESTVIFSIETDPKGGLKIDLDSVTEKHVEKSVKKEVFEERPPSPSLSLSTITSGPIFNSIPEENGKGLKEEEEPDYEKGPPSPPLSVSTIADSEHIFHGQRRRAPSISSQSVASSTLFDGDDENVSIRSSTPSVFGDDDLSNTSFISCVSNLSIETSSSQETVKGGNTVSSPISSVPQRARTISYERINKDRYSYEDEGNWRSAPRRAVENKPTSPSKPLPSLLRNITYRKTTPTNNTTKIPSLMGLPISQKSTPPKRVTQAQHPRPLPHGRVNTSIGSYASAARSPSNSTIRGSYSSTTSHGNYGATKEKSPSNSTNRGSYYSTSSHGNSGAVKEKQSIHSPALKVQVAAPNDKIKLAITTGPDGKMRLNFSNSTSSESWTIDGILKNFEKINVYKTPQSEDSNNNF